MILCDCKEDLSIAAEELIPLFFILNIKAGALFWLCYMQQEKKPNTKWLLQGRKLCCNTGNSDHLWSQRQFKLLHSNTWYGTTWIRCLPLFPWEGKPCHIDSIFLLASRDLLMAERPLQPAIDWCQYACYLCKSEFPFKTSVLADFDQWHSIY